MSFLIDTEWIRKLRSLNYNWDGEGATAPSEVAIDQAKKFVLLVSNLELNIEDIDADVLGGVAIYLYGIDKRRAWIAIRNSGKASVVLTNHGKSEGFDLEKFPLEKLKCFLKGKENSIFQQMRERELEVMHSKESSGNSIQSSNYIPGKFFQADSPRKPTMAYSFVATDDGSTLAPAELTKELRAKQSQKLQESMNATQQITHTDEVVHVLPSENLVFEGDVQKLVSLLIEKDVGAWLALSENLRTYLMTSVNWEYSLNENNGLINLHINGVEVRWNGSDWVLVAFEYPR